MKLLVVLVSMFVATSAFADSQRDAQNAFNKMGALEAYNSSMFSKTVDNIYIPGTSTWVDGNSLCKKSGMIMTKTPAYRQVCVAWNYRNSEGDRKSTTSLRVALKNNATCTQKVNGPMLAHPINYTAEVTIWGARKSGELKTVAGGKAKVYRSYQEAKEAGSPVALGTKTVSKSVATTYNVNFFRKTAHDRFDNSKKVGSHRFGVATCN